MENNLSEQLYQKYFNLTNRTIEVTLKNGRKITGVFVSFCLGEEERNEPYTTKWHIVNEKDKHTLGIDAFGFLIGEYIEQKDIESIKFFDDNSEMKFKTSE